MKKKKKAGKIIFVIFALLAGLASLGFLLYPVISNIFSDQMASKVVVDYKNEMSHVEGSKFTEARQAAEEYNVLLAGILKDSDKEAFGEDYLSVLENDYNKLINLTGDGMMGYVEVPIIHVNLPIYHGNTGDEVTDVSDLERGSVHLFGTSLPVGGDNTHTAISAHTGLSTNRLFTDLEAVKVGDVFYLHVLNETLAYQVVDIFVVEPWDTSLLRVYKGHDYATLVTCTPYGVNSHRLLVRGERIPYEEAKEIEEVQEDRAVESPWQQNYLKGILYGLLGVVIFIIILVMIRMGLRKSKKNETKNNTKVPEPTSVEIARSKEETKEWGNL